MNDYSNPPAAVVSNLVESAPLYFPLAYSSNGFTGQTLVDSIQMIASCGYQGIELLGDRPHWDPTQPPSASMIKRVLQEEGLTISNVNGNTAMFFWPEWMPETIFEPALSHADPKVRRRRIDSTLALLDWTAEVGGPRVSVTSGRCPGLHPPDQELGYFAESLHELAVEAEKRSLQLSIEYEPGLLVERWTEVADMIKRVDHPALGVNLDVGHAQCIGESPQEAIRGLAGHIWNLHIEDIQDHKHYHLIPGEGNLDLIGVLRTLKEIEYTGWLTVELYTYANNQDLDAAQKAYQALRALQNTQDKIL
jgi:sugar phosphate isomerase/epimerase